MLTMLTSCKAAPEPPVFLADWQGVQHVTLTPAVTGTNLVDRLQTFG